MKIKLVFLWGLFIIGLCSVKAQNLSLIPAPNTSIVQNDKYLTVHGWRITGANEYKHLIEVFKSQVSSCGINFTYDWFPGDKAPNLVLRMVDPEKLIDGESYRLKIDTQLVTLEFNHSNGLFYGLQTLVQLSLSNGGTKIPCLEIKDNPRFKWRGLMLDESRHFFGKQTVKRLLDWMAFYKMNRFHWHLTDAPGWRVEIKKYPRLTEIGGIGDHSNCTIEAQYYTQDEIREIIQYAHDRFIDVIPEIDMPGHATAANIAYPEYSGGGSDEHPNFTFDPGKENTYAFLTDILKEVGTLFPSQYIHLGGDEVHFGNQQWMENKGVLELMENQNLKTLTEVEYYFINRMADTVQVLDRTVIGWDEIVNAGISPDNGVVMWWRHDKQDQLVKALNQGYRTILCPRIPFYLDFVQHDSHESGRRWDNEFVPLNKILSFQSDIDDVIAEHSELVIGVQANIWTEAIHSVDRLDYLTFPRIAGVAEVAWSHVKEIDQDDFMSRLKESLSLYEKMKISYFNPVSPEWTPEIKNIVK